MDFGPTTAHVLAPHAGRILCQCAGAAIDIKVGAIRDRRLFADESLHAPRLLDIEVAHVLRWYVGSRQMIEERAAVEIY